MPAPARTSSASRQKARMTGVHASCELMQGRRCSTSTTFTTARNSCTAGICSAQSVSVEHRVCKASEAHERGYDVSAGH